MNFIKSLMMVIVLIPTISNVAIAMDPDEARLKRARLLGIQTMGQSKKSLTDLEADLAKARAAGDGSDAVVLQAIRDFKTEKGQTIQERIDARLAKHQVGQKYEGITGDDAAIGRFHNAMRKREEAALAAAGSDASPEQILGGRIVAQLKAAMSASVIPTIDFADPAADEKIVELLENMSIKIDLLKAEIDKAIEESKRKAAQVAAATAQRLRSSVTEEDDGVPLF